MSKTTHKMSGANHTPKIRWIEDADGQISIEVDDGTIFAEMTENQADSIVRAVNSHAEMLEALKTMSQKYVDLAIKTGNTFDLTEAVKAIAKAEGGK